MLLPLLTNNFLPEVTANLQRMIENPLSLCPLRLIFNLLTCADAICQKHSTRDMMPLLLEFVSALLRLHLKTIVQLEKLPFERLRYYF